MRSNKQIDVSRALALAGAFSFVSSCAKACLLPFLTLYLRQLGLTPAMTGVAVGTQHLISLAWTPVASVLAKHYNKRRAAIHASLVSSAAVALLLLLLPPAGVRTDGGACNVSEVRVAPTQSLGAGLPVGSAGTETPPARTTLSQPHSQAAAPSNDTQSAPGSSGNQSVQTETSNVQNSSVVVTKTLVEPERSSPVRSRRSEQPEEDGAERSLDFLDSLKAMDVQHQLFFLVLIIVSLWEFASAPLDWTVEDGLYEYLDFADASDRRGGAGVWGLLGAACGVGATGLLVSRLDCLVAARTPRSAVHFFSYAALTALALPVAAYLPLHLNRKRDRANGLLKAAQLVRGSPRALLCAATTLLVGVASSAVDNFLLWQMQDRGSSELHMGAALALALLSQAAYLLLARHVSKLLSPGRVLAVGAASLALQCFYYSFLWGPWAALPAQALSCFSSGALWWAVRVQCEDLATPGAERSVGRVYSSLALRLGAGLGSFAGGLVVQRFGVAWLFRGAAAGLTAWCACLPLLQCRTPQQRRINYSRLLAADASEASDSESEQDKDWLANALENDRRNNSSSRYGRRLNQ